MQYLHTIISVHGQVTFTFDLHKKIGFLAIVDKSVTIQVKKGHRSWDTIHWVSACLDPCSVKSSWPCVENGSKFYDRVEYCNRPSNPLKTTQKSCMNTGKDQCLCYRPDSREDNSSVPSPPPKKKSAGVILHTQHKHSESKRLAKWWYNVWGLCPWSAWMQELAWSCPTIKCLTVFSVMEACISTNTGRDVYHTTLAYNNYNDMLPMKILHCTYILYGKNTATKSTKTSEK